MKITVKGTGAIERAFRELPVRLAKKVIRQGLRAGAKVVQADATGNAPVESGLLKKAIKVRASKSRRKNTISLGVIIGAGDFKGETYYGAFENFGWKAGKNDHEIPGKHFMDRALSEKGQEAATVAEAIIASGIEREAQGLAK